MRDAWQRMFRCTWREIARENDGEIQMRERGEREQVLDGRGGEKVQDVQSGEWDDRAHVKRMQRNEREGGKGAGRNTERRRKGNIMDEKDMEDERKDRKKNINFLELHVFLYL
jgi:hypothetical protein